MIYEEQLISIIVIAILLFLYKFTKNRDRLVLILVYIMILIFVLSGIILLVKSIKGVYVPQPFSFLPLYIKTYILTLTFLVYYNWLYNLIIKKQKDNLWEYAQGFLIAGVIVTVGSLIGVLFFKYHWLQIVGFSNLLPLVIIIYFQHVRKSIVLSNFQINTLIICSLNIGIMILIYKFKSVSPLYESYNSFKDFFFHASNFLIPTWIYITFGGIYSNAYPEKLEMSFIKFSLSILFIIYCLSNKDVIILLNYIPFLKKELGNIHLVSQGSVLLVSGIISGIKAKSKEINSINEK